MSGATAASGLAKRLTTITPRFPAKAATRLVWPTPTSARCWQGRTLMRSLLLPQPTGTRLWPPWPPPPARTSIARSRRQSPSAKARPCWRRCGGMAGFIRPAHSNGASMEANSAWPANLSAAAASANSNPSMPTGTGAASVGPNASNRVSRCPRTWTGTFTWGQCLGFHTMATARRTGLISANSIGASTITTSFSGPRAPTRPARWRSSWKALVSDPPDLVREPLRPDEVHLYRNSGHSNNFLECVRSRKKTICDADIAHRAASALLLGGVAKQLGRNLKWDPQAEQFPGDEEANRFLSIAKRAPWRV